MADEKKGWAQRATEWSERTQQEAAQKAALKRNAEALKRNAEIFKDLAKATRNWSATNCLRRYEGNAKGDQLFQEESDVFANVGYVANLQTDDGSHIHVGRLLLTGGLSAFAGGRGIRSKGKYTVTFVKGTPQPPAAAAPSVAPSQPDVADQLRKLGELRDAGVVTAEEFEAKKAELLARM